VEKFRGIIHPYVVVLHAEEELLVPKDESQYVDQPHEEVHGVEEATHAEPSIRNGRKRTTEADRLRLDVA
jgi:hypothetical protein